MGFIQEFIRKYEDCLNADPELGRRLKGFKNFSGMPDGHYNRARQQGKSAQVRAVRCYPFGGSSQLNDAEVIGIRVKDGDAEFFFTVTLGNFRFSVKPGEAENPKLNLELTKDLFIRTLLGRYRWMWVIGMEEVKVSWASGLPHSDWVTILEMLVVMQELVEFDPDLLDGIEKK
jgi:hypothetical protein